MSLFTLFSPAINDCLWPHFNVRESGNEEGNACLEFKSVKMTFDFSERLF